MFQYLAISVLLVYLTEVEPVKVEKQVGDVKCDICELVIRGIDELVGKNASEEKINATIYEICNDLPGTAKTFVSKTYYVLCALLL